MGQARGQPVTSRGRVLIVEDEADLAWVERYNLESEGYEVHVASEGQAAIEELETFEPDVVVLDLMLPHVNGWAVLEKAGQMSEHRRPKVIVVSAVAGLGEQVHPGERGIGSFLPKPFDMDDLVRLVGETISPG
jgi:DNA-binding response OmpR family regulator